MAQDKRGVLAQEDHQELKERRAKSTEIEVGRLASFNSLGMFFARQVPAEERKSDSQNRALAVVRNGPRSGYVKIDGTCRCRPLLMNDALEASTVARRH